MSRTWQVAEDIWLGLARSRSAPPGLPLRRHLVDQEAAAGAERAALAASGLGGDDYAVSRSHTQGIGAAVVACAKVRLGVDLVRIDRVSERHAASVLSRGEWVALEPFAPIRPALAWALKEAAAKATGDPLRHFPDGLRIEAGPHGVIVRRTDQPEVCYLAEWVRLGALLCVWVRGRGRRDFAFVTPDRPVSAAARPQCPPPPPAGSRATNRS